MISIDKPVHGTSETTLSWKRALIGTTAVVAVGMLSACEEPTEQDDDGARVQVCAIRGEHEGDIIVVSVDEARSDLYSRDLQHPACGPVSGY